MAAVSIAKARRLLDELGSRKAAAKALGVGVNWFSYNLPCSTLGPGKSDRLLVALHRQGLPLERAADACKISIRRSVQVIQAAEQVEINRIRFAGEAAAWRAYLASLPVRQMGA